MLTFKILKWKKENQCNQPCQEAKQERSYQLVQKEQLTKSNKHSLKKKKSVDWE